MLNRFENIISSRTPLRKIRERETGGKGWNLFRLQHLGFLVPEFFVISSRIFERTIRVKNKQIKSILSSIDYADPSSGEKAALEIRTMILAMDFPTQFSRDLREALARLFEPDVLLSVRSSAVGEDSANHSFAGQLDSFLNVRTSGVPDAIRRVWASAFSARALVYRKEKGISQKSISAGVIIQAMVQSVASGILFTRNPENLERECIISAGYGLGEGIVSNRVETDLYRIPWHSRETVKDIRAKDFRLVLDSSLQEGVRMEHLPVEDCCRPVLMDGQIQELCHSGIKAETRFGRPQDMEWAVDARGKIWILQARPIVFTEPKAGSDNFRVWDNSNIIESYPGLTLPLTFSFVRSCYQRIFQDASRAMVFNKRELSKRQDIFRGMIGLLRGRVYYNLLNWYEMLSYLPGFKKRKESWDQMIGIARKIGFPQKKGSTFDRFCSSLLIVWKLLTVDRTARKFFKSFDRAYDRFKSLEFGKSSAHELMSVFDALDKEFSDKWYLTLYNDFSAMTFYDRLKKLCARWVVDSDPNLHNNLLCGEQGIESAAPVRSLVHLAELLRTRPLYQELIRERDDRAVWRKIHEDPAYEELRIFLDDHLRLYGDRGLEELKLEMPTFREDPSLLIGLMRSYYSLGLTAESMNAKERKVRKDAEALVRSRLKNPVQRIMFQFVLTKARRSIANRENMRFARTRLFGIVRRLFRRMGMIIEEQGLLISAADLNYLTVDEVFGVAGGTAVTQNLKALVALRKFEYEEFGRQSLKERLETTGFPCQNSLTEEGRENNGAKKLRGINCSSGIAEGAAKVVLDPRAANTEGRYILVARSTDPGWVFLMVSSKGIVVERGSVLSHTAIIGRELGIPTIVGVKDATKIIPDGAHLIMNGSTGEVRWQ